VRAFAASSSTSTGGLHEPSLGSHPFATYHYWVWLPYPVGRFLRRSDGQKHILTGSLGVNFHKTSSPSPQNSTKVLQRPKIPEGGLCCGVVPTKTQDNVQTGAKPLQKPKNFLRNPHNFGKSLDNP
jgi:hypothetical protein